MKAARLALFAIVLGFSSLAYGESLHKLTSDERNFLIGSWSTPERGPGRPTHKFEIFQSGFNTLSGKHTQIIQPAGEADYELHVLERKFNVVVTKDAILFRLLKRKQLPPPRCGAPLRKETDIPMIECDDSWFEVKRPFDKENLEITKVVDTETLKVKQVYRLFDQDNQ